MSFANSKVKDERVFCQKNRLCSFISLVILQGNARVTSDVLWRHSSAAAVRSNNFREWTPWCSKTCLLHVYGLNMGTRWVLIWKPIGRFCSKIDLYQKNPIWTYHISLYGAHITLLLGSNIWEWTPSCNKTNTSISGGNAIEVLNAMLLYCNAFDKSVHCGSRSSNLDPSDLLQSSKHHTVIYTTQQCLKAASTSLHYRSPIDLFKQNYLSK